MIETGAITMGTIFNRLTIGAAEERVHAMPGAGEEVLAFPDTQACQMAGVSMRRLRYWEEVGLVVRSIKRRLSEHNTVRLISGDAAGIR